MTMMVIRWIKKNKYTKHKYDFFIAVAGWEIAFWVVIMGYQIIRFHNIFSTILYAVFICFILFFEFMRLRDLKEMKDTYDDLWMRRKNPVVYNLVKDFCEEIKERGEGARILNIKMNLAFTAIMVFMNPILIPVYGFGVMYMYSNSIFDFDEPDQKKKVKDSITETLLRSWQNLIGQLNPIPTKG